MFANFNKAFRKNPLKTKVPSEVLAALSHKLPDGFKYVNIGEGACGIASDYMHLKFNVKIPEGAIKNKDYIKTANDLANYIYRTQQELEVIPDKDGCILINDNKFSFSDLLHFPLEEKYIKSQGAFVIKPEPFPDPFPIEFEANGAKKVILIQRQPYDSIYETLFKSVNDDCLQISYLINERDFSLKLTINISLEKAKTIKEIVTASKLYYGFLNGTLKMGEFPLNQKPDEKVDEDFSKTIEFWEKVLAVENTLGIVFIPTSRIQHDDGYWIECLYRTLVLKQPYRENIKMSTVKMRNVSFTQEGGFKKKSGMVFEYLREIAGELLGAKINLIEFSIIYNFIITNATKVDKSENDYDVQIEPDGKEGIYRSTQYFKTKDEADVFRTVHIKNHEIFKKAEIIEVL
ncbi:abortive infection system toxin AbiGii family protein [Desulforamulus ruminis]|uniref:Uncharacterized protein n=1 Tax=Desulforamulus ruminis (strain ATCC 23193 / DSM 2154 / NCIMB 8452 / DL) TaxID=696281 RepID=F6DK41_DESRL|nr:abortive infection system toxin AbiGii family protein [Desulforamulus ruminis]AEG60355.1 hypothetical protein Desru_2103 [Desulforamulus ruminis DSM 2154]